METRASQLARPEVFWQLKDIQGPPSNTGQGGADKLGKISHVSVVYGSRYFGFSEPLVWIVEIKDVPLAPLLPTV